MFSYPQKCSSQAYFDVFYVLGRHVEQHICWKVLLPVLAAALLWFWLSWHIAVPLRGFTNSCAHCELEIYFHIVSFLKSGQLYLARCRYCNLSVWGAGGTSDCKQPEKGNHEVTEAGRDLWRSYSPASCSKNHLVSVGSCCSGALPDKCWKPPAMRFCHLAGWLIPVL